MSAYERRRVRRDLAVTDGVACCEEHAEATDDPRANCHQCLCCADEHGPSDADLERIERSREAADIAHYRALRDAGRRPR